MPAETSWSRIRASASPERALISRPLNRFSGHLKFVKDIREKWRDAKNMSQAAVVLSFPSYFWTFDFLNLPGEHFAALRAVTRSLQNLGIQYRLSIWGDDEFVPDRAELSRDELLILPAVSHITNAQAEKMRSFIENGGHGLVLGNFATRDHLDQKRARPPFSLLKPGPNKWGGGELFFLPDGRGHNRTIPEGIAEMGLKHGSL